MKRLVALGICLIVGVELLALIVQDRRFVLIGAGIALTLVLLNVRRVLGHPSEPEAEPETTTSVIRCVAGCRTPRR